MPFTWDRTPIASAPISAIVPHFQAADILSGLVASLSAQLIQRGGIDYEMLLVDDGSSDGSASVIAGLAQRFPRIRALRHEKQEGYGACLRTGLAAAVHPLVLTLPGDGSYDPADLPKFLTLIDQSDVVSGTRTSKPWLRRKLQRLPAQFFFGVGLSDVACHFRLYRREIFQRIPIQSQGCFADTEILAKANFMDRILAETEISWKPATAAGDLYGSTVLSDALRLFTRPDFGVADSAPAAREPTTP